jgi:ribosomal protein S18 acetylase RimI-like enzyme
MDVISIIPLMPDDIDDLLPLAHSIWHAHYPGIITVEQIDYMLERGYTREVVQDEMECRGITWLKILDGAVMIGFVSVGPYGEGVMKLHKLYLLPGYHGQGIGAAALQEVERLAIERKISRLVLNVNKHNVKAIHAYQRAGWHVAEEVCVDIGGGFVMDDYVMAKDLIG